MAAESELVINRFIFDPSKLDRSTFLNMKSGKSRFWVKKLKGYTRSEFKVKTKTMVAGVRGSDFVLIAGPSFTEVMALDDTVLEIVSLAAPDKVIVLRSFEKVRVDEGQEVSPIEKITPAEAARIKNELPMPFDKDVMDAAGIFKTEGTVDSEEEDSKEQPTEEVSQAGQAAAEVAVKKEVVPTEEGGVSPALAEKGETAPRLQPTEEVYQVEKSTTEVAVKEETVPTEEDETPVQDEMAPILDVGGKPVILIAEEDLEPVLSDDEVNNLLTKETDIDWFDKAMINNPGDQVDIAAIPTGSAGGEEDLGQQSLDAVAEEFIQDAILAPLPGLPGLPGP